MLSCQLNHRFSGYVWILFHECKHTCRQLEPERMEATSSESREVVSSSLLAGKRKCCVPKDCCEQFDLGLTWGDNLETENQESEPPPTKKGKEIRKRLSLQRKRCGSDKAVTVGATRWTFLSDTEEKALSERFVPKNTATSTKWAYTNFESWQKERNTRFVHDPERQVPADLLEV